MACFCLVLAVFLTVAFIDYDPAQLPSNQSGAATVVENGALAAKSLPVGKENLVGPFGAYSTYWSYEILGGGAWLIPVFLFWMTYLALRSAKRFVGTRVFVMFLSVTSLAGLLAMQSSFLSNPRWFPHGPGGMLGGFVYRDGLKNIFGVFGAGMLLGIVYLLGILFIFTKDVGAEFEKFVAGFHNWRANRANRKTEQAELARKEKEARAKHQAETAKTAAVAPNAPPVGSAGKKLSFAKTQSDPLAKPPAPREPGPPAAEAKPAFVPPPKPEPKPEPKPAPSPKLDAKPASVEPAAAVKPVIHKPASPAKAIATELPIDEDYKRFPLSLLKEQDQPPDDSDEEHTRNIGDLVRILGEFGVEVTQGEIQVGPVITCYEVVPAAGVRVEKIAGLDKNIALGMKAQSVRILAPIPGKAAVGVEIPNRHPTAVGIREILESQDWRDVRAEIPIALGKDVSGLPLISDLTRMPHLLIAGATGSGKSVCINSIIASIVYRRGPRDVRLIMVDPKVVELKIFNALPHMLIPVVTEPKKVPAALKWLLSEMERRYQQFAKVGVRNIAGFNNRKKATSPTTPPSVEQTALGLPQDDDLPIPDHLAYIVAIIDELADLMMVAPAEIETSIARLAQLARAAGIHLIIATQRPSVNVITGVIKANLPSRIAFQVASQVDSRTILDTKGADTLIGRGDMLFSPPGTSRLVRAQGAFVSDDEVQEMVKFLKENNQPPVYAQEVQAQIDRDTKEEEDGNGDDESEDGDLGDDEELYQKALDVIKSTGRASTSMIQRRLRIGYNRAARIMDLMEEKGVVGPENGSSPREILVDLDKL
jgi:S-DNA-T family DNA segregation ATPase FtsK/SpoIIIE